MDGMLLAREDLVAGLWSDVAIEEEAHAHLARQKVLDHEDGKQSDCHPLTGPWRRFSRSFCLLPRYLGKEGGDMGYHAEVEGVEMIQIPAAADDLVKVALKRERRSFEVCIPDLEGALVLILEHWMHADDVVVEAVEDELRRQVHGLLGAQEVVEGNDSVPDAQGNSDGDEAIVCEGDVAVNCNHPLRYFIVSLHICKHSRSIPKLVEGQSCFFDVDAETVVVHGSCQPWETLERVVDDADLQHPIVMLLLGVDT
eukprot:756670-Hanusia_phi.AAC.10